MVLYKTKDLLTFVNKITFLEPFEDYGVIWQSFYDGIYFSILVDE